MEVADIVAGGAEQHRRRRFVEAQQVDDGVLDIGGRDGDGLIGDVAMAAILAHRRDAQRVLLVALGERDDRLGHRRREQQGAAGVGRRVEDLLEIVAKAHVEHFVGFIEDGDLDRPQLQRAAFEMVAQTARRADDDMGALVQRLALLRGVHAADAGGDARAGLAIEPDQLAADLQRQFAGRRDDEGERRAGAIGAAILAQQLGRHGEAEGDGLARSGLRRDQQIAAFGIGFEHGGLHGRGRGIATGGQRFAEKRRECFKVHGPPCPRIAQNANRADGTSRRWSDCRRRNSWQIANCGTVDGGGRGS